MRKRPYRQDNQAATIDSSSHHLASFVIEAQTRLQLEYERIQSRRTKDRRGRSRLEDPGTAGDQGEENWAQLIRDWLPSYFTVVTKGKIIFPDGSASAQVDVVVLSPSYPKLLIDRRDKYYLSSGVAAAFECKVTGKLSHIDEAFEAASLIASKFRKTGEPSPHSELNSIPYGLLCHSLDGGDRTTISEKLQSRLGSSQGPRSLIDFLCVADKGYWGIHKSVHLTDPHGIGAIGVSTAYFSDFRVKSPNSHSPVGRFLVGLYNRLSRDFPEMRGIASDVSNLGIDPGSRPRVWGGPALTWPLENCFSEGVLRQLRDGKEDRQMFGAWSCLLGVP